MFSKLLHAVALVTMFVGASATAQSPTFVFTAIPDQDETRLVERFSRFAKYLAERGRPAVTFDYRDIGGSRHGSLKHSTVRMRDWCVLDVPGVIAWAAQDALCPPGQRSVGWLERPD